MNTNLSQPPNEQDPLPVGFILKVALTLSLVVLAVSVVKFFQRKDANATAAATAEQAAPETSEPEPAFRPPPRRSDPRPVSPLRAAARPTPARPEYLLQSASNLWASAESDYLRAARIPELRAGWDGVLARFEPSVYYRVPAHYEDELRGDFGQIAEATNVLKQFEAELRTLEAGHNKDREDYLRHARAADEHRQDESSAAMKKLIELQTLYQERKRDFEQEATRTKPQLNDPPGVFEQKLSLYERVNERFATDIKQLESAILAVQKEVYASREALRSFSKSTEVAFEQSAAETTGRLHSLSNRVQQRLGEVNTSIRDYNAKLGRYGSPIESSR